MDPNANLEEQRRLMSEILKTNEADMDAIRLAELVSALDEWLSNGGFLPSDWQRR